MKPLNHSLIFFKQYIPLLSSGILDDFTNCKVAKGEFDNWVLALTLDLAKNNLLFKGETDAIEEFPKILTSFGDICAKTVESVNKSFIRFYRPVLKGQVYIEKHHRSLLTIRPSFK